MCRAASPVSPRPRCHCQHCPQEETVVGSLPSQAKHSRGLEPLFRQRLDHIAWPGSNVVRFGGIVIRFFLTPPAIFRDCPDRHAPPFSPKMPSDRAPSPASQPPRQRRGAASPGSWAPRSHSSQLIGSAPMRETNSYAFSSSPGRLSDERPWQPEHRLPSLGELVDDFVEPSGLNEEFDMGLAKNGAS
jgi:hypothetical protein